MSNVMKLGKIAATALQVIALSTLTAAASSASTVRVPDFLKPSADNGIYKTELVSTRRACDAVCAADPKCRGTIQHQPDTRQSSFVCGLHDGSGSNPAFASLKAEPFDVNQAVRELNEYRAEYGLTPVTLETRLIEASRVHADDLAQAGIISHDGTDGSTHGERINRQGYNFSFAGENVATGQRSWASVFQAWKDSPSHNETLLHPDVTEFGIAMVEEPSTTYGTYWAMLLTLPMDMSFLEASNVL